VFGEKFYRRLSKLAPWQQTTFALCLAERMYPNYVLFCQTCDFGDAQAFRRLLDQLWQFLSVRGYKVDLEAELEKFEPHVPEPKRFEHYGVYPALDACVTLACAINSVICRTGEEGREASNASLGAVCGFAELLAGEVLSDEQLYQQACVEQEMEFQVELLKRLDHPRDSELIMALRFLASNEGVSNLGITLDQD
jgi:uncharacterized protein YjaG (DUF416 family)